jgi:putative endonuclease
MAALKKPGPWSVYLVRRADGALYCGIALDVAARFAQHEAGLGAKALRGRGPRALRAEARIKRLQKADKERLAASAAFARRFFAALAEVPASADA